MLCFNSVKLMSSKPLPTLRSSNSYSKMLAFGLLAFGSGGILCVTVKH